MIKLQTFLRPAVVKDVFDREGLGAIIEEKQVYYKNSNDVINGPFRLYKPFKENETEYYVNLFQLLNDERVFVVDPLEYSESIAVQLPLKNVQEFDIMQGGSLIVHTMYFLKSANVVDGPFFINKNTTKKELKNKAANKTILCLAKTNDLQVVCRVVA